MSGMIEKTKAENGIDAVGRYLLDFLKQVADYELVARRVDSIFPRRRDVLLGQTGFVSVSKCSSS